MTSLTVLLVIIGLLKGLELAMPSRRQSSSGRRPRHVEGPEGDEVLSLMWQGLCLAIEEKAPWLFVVGNFLFYGAAFAVLWWLWTHRG